MQIQVSPEDEWLLSAYPWRIDPDGYVVFSKTMGGRNTVFLMHRIIKNAPRGLVVDHIDGNPQNNRRENLRICQHAENMRNRKPNKGTATGVKGVSLAGSGRRSRPYKAEIKASGSRIQLGYYEHVSDAALAYKLAAIHYHGEFARV